MTQYVVGFLFSPDERRVVLMEKKRPEWQIGKLNGPGGRVGNDEPADVAMEREFKEETGAHGIPWRPFAILKHGVNEIMCFMAKADVTVETKTDESVRWYDFEDLDLEICVHNLYWLLPLALCPDMPVASVTIPGGPR